MTSALEGKFIMKGFGFEEQDVAIDTLPTHLTAPKVMASVLPVLDRLDCGGPIKGLSASDEVVLDELLRIATCVRNFGKLVSPKVMDAMEHYISIPVMAHYIRTADTDVAKARATSIASSWNSMSLAGIIETGPPMFSESDLLLLSVRLAELPQSKQTSYTDWIAAHLLSNDPTDDIVEVLAEYVPVER